ncbi:MAG: hypothetical protein GQ477_03555 [Nanohaloarchaea archaeon]|nr:hypothetical protein [Candidatus Nanohaloarchaea archaeon]
MGHDEPCTNIFCNDKLFCGAINRAYCSNYTTSIDKCVSTNIIPVARQIEIIKTS